MVYTLMVYFTEQTKFRIVVQQESKCLFIVRLS